MDRRSSCVFLLAVLLVCVQMPGCHGGTTTIPLAVVTTSLPNGTVGTAYYATLTATGGTSPYTWSQTSGGAMPGGVTLTSTGAFSGTPTTAGTFGPYVFTATDSTSTTAASQSMSITISSTTLAVTTSTLPSGSVGTAYSVTLGASGGSLPYTWTETSGGALPPGLAAVTSAGVIAGTPTTAGVYGPYVFTVTDAKSATAATASLTITINGGLVAACTPLGNEAALTSADPYAFLVKGTDSYGNPIDIAGSFTPNGAGGITAAAVDYNGFTNGPAQLQVNLTASSYAFGPSMQGCLALSFSGLATAAASAKRADTAAQFKPANETRTRKIEIPAVAAAVVSSVQFSFYLSGFDGTVYHTGRIIESDNTSGTGTNASGFIHVQTPGAFALAALQGNYAFGVDGWTATASTPATLRTSMAGTFTNTTGTLSGGYSDLNTGGTLSGELTGGYGSLSSTIDPTTGRGTGSYFLTTPTGNLTYDFAFYILNASDLILLSTDLAMSGATTPLLSGRALVSSAPGDAVPLNGYYLLASQGLQTIGISSGNIAEIGTMNANSSGAIPTATIYSNYAGTYASNQYPGGSYTLEAASGRAAISLGTSPSVSTSPVVYLTAGSSDDGIAGFLVGTDGQASSGVLVTQTTTTPNYAVGNISGNYATSTEEDVDGLNGAFLGGFTFNGIGGYTVTPLTTGKVTNVPSLGSILVNTDGSGNLDGGNFPLVTNGEVLFAIPDSGDPLLFVFTEGTLPQ
jgi:large repetitive protein